MRPMRNAKLYKEKTKMWHDKKILKREFKRGQKVLHFNSWLRLFPRKLRSKWFGLFTIERVLPFGAIELKEEGGRTFQVNEQRVKHYYGEEERKAASILLDNA